MRSFDVVVHDSVGLPYTLDTTTGIGGSEIQTIRLCKALARHGTVLLHRNDEPIRCKALIVQRFSTIPQYVKADRTFIQLHDLPGPQPITVNVPLVALSEFQARQFSAPNRVIHVIPAMLPDLVYTMSRPPRVPGRYLYAASAVKGWDVTYARWQKHRQPGDVLRVLDCGYSRVHRIADPSIDYLPPLTDDELVHEVASSAGIFYVNRHPECFPTVIAMADALGTPVHVLTLGNPGALPEIAAWNGTTITASEAIFELSFTTRRDYRISTILPMWVKLLGL